ncbi:hypothetical protein A2382_04995 [Candidatus Woesebacteria bacterium RIFOXYB1_FULL_38_16]|uniref:Type-4 uracil-DNA glycosylase n=1 Tax=Candidatus Woesebacteria bacterium RIFOXYB1_FULL_38_16 TaxID=1802538 RepID=A0A1F8CWV6_9BACT|nr:MAG: hypothetical protein A2382_04995 [Candidatus Woesebacteria bacterium RIFOXYB1_FULL_38_16]
MSKEKKLSLIKEYMVKADLPLKKGATRLVFGEGSPDAKVLFLGEAPGYWEDIKGVPFVGNAGTLLNKMLLVIGMPREEVYITNIIHYRPSENRDPLPSEIAAFQPYLDRIIRVIEPKVIVTLGRFSMNKFLPDAKISRIHGKEHVVKFGEESKAVVYPMYHPAAALRSEAVLQDFEDDFRSLSGILRKLEEKEEIKEEVKKESWQMKLI